MQAMILAAGLGTRLKPWTLEHPKALVPVADEPMLSRVIRKMVAEGFDRIVVNVHHFGEQIIDYLAANDFGVETLVSDERGRLLDTGGGILHARRLFLDEPLLVHNVDILSDLPLRQLMEESDTDADANLVVSRRDSSRLLGFDAEMNLVQWRNVKTGEMRAKAACEGPIEDFAFSGIYTLMPSAFPKMEGFGDRFPVMDFFLSAEPKVKGIVANHLNLIDIGKPETLTQANSLFLSNLD